MAENKNFGFPGKDPIWTWNWPWAQTYGRMFPGYYGAGGGTTPLWQNQYQFPEMQAPSQWATGARAEGYSPLPFESYGPPKPAPEPGPTLNELMMQGEIIIPGVMELPNGRYVDPKNGYVLSPKLAADLIREYREQNEDTLTAAQEAGLKLQEQQLALSEKRFTWEQRKEERAQSRRVKELEFQNWKQEQLAKLTGPADWIRRWQIMQTPSPYKRDIPHWWTVAQTPGPESSRAEEQEYLEARRRFYAELNPTPGLPPAPEWLPSFVPSQTAGREISAMETRTPSGQQWLKTPESVREGLRGYTEWAGYRPYGDIMEHMAMMQPEPVAGATNRRWQPISQWR